MDLLHVRLCTIKFEKSITIISISDGGLQYTDIDYYVFSDGADNILQVKFPFLDLLQ